MSSLAPTPALTRQSNKESIKNHFLPNNRFYRLWIFNRFSYFFRMPGSQWALNEAKRNLVNNYLVVGVTEEIADFLAVLETVLPRFFKGASEKFASGRFRGAFYSPIFKI